MDRYAENRPCPKCGQTARTTHVTRLGRSVMRRSCLRCGYKWDEAPLDAATAAQPQRDGDSREPSKEDVHLLGPRVCGCSMCSEHRHLIARIEGK